jgi:hypothetical protein
MIGIMAPAATITNRLSRPTSGRDSGKNISANKRTMSGAKFEFITSVGPPVKARNDEESNRIVRIHAMRSFLQKRASRSLDSQGSRSVGEVLGDASKDPRADSPVTGTTGKFKLKSWKRKSAKRKVVVQHKGRNKKLDVKNKSGRNEMVIANDLGPIEIMKVALSPETRRLIHHCESTTQYSTSAPILISQTDHHNFTQNSFAVNPEGSFFDFAKQDTALMHALLCLVANHFNLTHSQDNSIATTDSAYHQALSHQAEAVQDLNVRLGHIEAHMDDGLIAAVAILANCEVSGAIYFSFHVDTPDID